MKSRQYDTVVVVVSEGTIPLNTLKGSIVDLLHLLDNLFEVLDAIATLADVPPRNLCLSGSPLNKNALCTSLSAECEPV